MIPYRIVHVNMILLLRPTPGLGCLPDRWNAAPNVLAQDGSRREGAWPTRKTLAGDQRGAVAYGQAPVGGVPLRLAAQRPS
jgi:hypothetical protein